jgi:hypothetical protein
MGNPLQEQDFFEKISSLQEENVGDASDSAFSHQSRNDHHLLIQAASRLSEDASPQLDVR